MNPFELAILMIFHPSDAFDEFKLKDKKMPILPSIIILTLVLVVRYIYVITVHIPLADVKLQDTNLLLEIGRLLIPILSLIISIYAFESIMSGETKLITVFTTICYSMIPYIIITPFMALLSSILSRQDSGLYNTISIVMWLWIGVLIFVSIMYMNNFSFKKTVLVSIISIVGVLLIWAIVIMVIAMSIQFLGFFNELYKEYILYNL